jgi:HAD superfamily hydrolase (TIGR01509 family)
MKPAPDIFQTTLIRLGRDAAETLFIDDAPANVAGAQAVGMQTIQFTPTIDLAAELVARGIRID